MEHYAQYIVILWPRGTIKKGKKDDATVASGMPCTIHTVGTGGGEEAGKKEHEDMGPTLLEILGPVPGTEITQTKDTQARISMTPRTIVWSAVIDVVVSGVSCLMRWRLINPSLGGQLQHFDLPRVWSVDLAAQHRKQPPQIEPKGADGQSAPARGQSPLRKLPELPDFPPLSCQALTTSPSTTHPHTSRR